MHKYQFNMIFIRKCHVFRHDNCNYEGLFSKPKKFTLQIFNQNILLIALGNFFKYSKRINEVPIYNQQKYFG